MSRFDESLDGHQGQEPYASGGNRVDGLPRQSLGEVVIKSALAVGFSLGVLALYRQFGGAMLPKLPVQLVLYFGAFSVFSYYQQQHYRRFDGASKVFELILGLSVVSSMLVWLGFLLYYGIKVAWWAPFALMGLDLALFPLGMVVARIITPLGVGLLAFVAWPVLAYWMFKLIPNAN